MDCEELMRVQEEVEEQIFECYEKDLIFAISQRIKYVDEKVVKLRLNYLSEHNARLIPVNS